MTFDTKMRKQKTQDERQLQNSICSYLFLNKVFFYENYNGGLMNSQGQFKTFGKWRIKGLADLTVINHGQVIFLEVKTPIGSQSKNQKEFEKWCKECGAFYYIVRSIEDITLLLKKGILK